MARARCATLAAAHVLARVVVLEFLPALSLGFAGDDFELLSLARIGGFSPRALVLPHRGAFVKPVLNAAWAAGAALFGASAGAWYTLALLVHLLDALLLGLLACRIARIWDGSDTPPRGGMRPAPDAAPWGLPTGSWTGLLTALVWSIHDRLSEPVFSIASLNHSLTFALYMAALLAAATAMETRAPRARLATALFVLLALFSYEVGASLPMVLILLAAFDPRSAGGLRGRLAALGLPTGAAALVWAVVQGVSRLAPGAVSYYTLSPAVWITNFAEIGLAFLHLPSYRIEPGAAWAIPLGMLLLAGALWKRLDRVLRFGCAWTLTASLPVLPIRFFSDRYHYVVFAGMALAAGRLAALTIARVIPVLAGETSPARGRRRAAVAGLTLVLLLHAAWSLLGAREQAAYYAFKSRIPARLLEEARESDARIAAHVPPVLAVVWRGDPDALAQAFQDAEARLLKPRFSEAHPFYVRPQGVLGAVYPADLFNTAAADRAGYYRRPAPERAARAIADGTFRVVPAGLFYWGRIAVPDLEGRLAGRLREALFTRREIPLALSPEEGPTAPGWNVAWLEPTDRAGAFEAEYGRSDARSE